MTQLNQVREHEVEEKPAELPSENSSESFWHSQPNQFLLGHRTTQALPPKADIVIIGSGITGTSAARWLAEDERARDLSVVMLEAREVCWGATGRNGGHCQPLLFDRAPDIGEFERKNVEAVASYIEEHSIDCEWRLSNACRTFWTPKSFEQARRQVENLKTTHPELGELVDATDDPVELKKHRVKPNCCGMTVTKGAGQLWPYKYVTFIVEKLVKEGKLNLQTLTPALEVKSDRVVTPRGEIKADKVLLATNGYTSYLVSDFHSIIVPIRCEMSALHPPTQERLEYSYGMVEYQGGNPEHDDYLVQRPFTDGSGGHLMFGGGRGHATYNCIGETADDIVDPGEAKYLRTVLPQMLELNTDKELKASHQWTGIKGYSRDNHPWVGRIHDGLWVCAGYTGHGMPNATLCAKAAVEMMLSDKEYDVIIRGLIQRGDLPEEYVLTGPRLLAAFHLPTVRELDTN